MLALGETWIVAHWRAAVRRLRDLGRTLLVVGCVAATASCSSQPGQDLERAAPVVRDSSGVRIVEYGEWSSMPASIKVQRQATYEVGWRRGDHPFESIVAGDVLPDGRAVVADGGNTLQVTVLSPTGKIDAVLGGPGDGPGEFREVFAVSHVDTATVVVDDPRSGRLSLFRSGQLVGDVQLGDAAQLRLLGTDSSGSLLMGPPLAWVVGRRYPTPWLASPLVTLNVAAQTFDTVGAADWDQSILFGGDNPFESEGLVGTARTGFIVGRGDIPEIRWLDAHGHLRQIIRWKVKRVKISDALWQGYERHFRELFEKRASASLINEEIKSMHAAAKEPLPVFDDLKVDADGDIWIRRYVSRWSAKYRAPQQYDVLTPSGEWLGTVALPSAARFTLLAVGSTRLIGAAKDSLDVQAVVAYGLSR